MAKHTKSAASVPSPAASTARGEGGRRSALRRDPTRMVGGAPRATAALSPSSRTQTKMNAGSLDHGSTGLSSTVTAQPSPISGVATRIRRARQPARTVESSALNSPASWAGEPQSRITCRASSASPASSTAQDSPSRISASIRRRQEPRPRSWRLKSTMKSSTNRPVSVMKSWYRCQAVRSLRAEPDRDQPGLGALEGTDAEQRAQQLGWPAAGLAGEQRYQETVLDRALEPLGEHRGGQPAALYRGQVTGPQPAPAQRPDPDVPGRDRVP